MPCGPFAASVAAEWGGVPPLEPLVVPLGPAGACPVPEGTPEVVEPVPWCPAHQAGRVFCSRCLTARAIGIPFVFQLALEAVDRRPRHGQLQAKCLFTVFTVAVVWSLLAC